MAKTYQKSNFVHAKSVKTNNNYIILGVISFVVTLLFYSVPAITVISIVVMFIFIVLHFIENSKNYKKHKMYFDEFVTNNKFEYFPVTHPQYILPAGHLLSSLVRHTKSHELFRCKIDNMETYLFNLASDTDNSQHKTISVCTIKLDKKLPHIILDNKKIADTIYFNQTTLLQGRQVVYLEAGFSDHYTTLAPDGYQADSLTFLSPELLDKILRSYLQLEYEIIDDYLITYRPTTSTKFYEEYYDQFLTTLNIGAELIENTANYRLPTTSHLNAKTRQHFDHSRLKTNQYYLLKLFGLVIISVTALYVTVEIFDISSKYLASNYICLFIIYLIYKKYR